MNNGGPAFPRPFGTDYAPEPCNSNVDAEGMSMRDWFAGQAIIGLLSDSERNGHLRDYAETAYILADFMLKAREQL